MLIDNFGNIADVWIDLMLGVVLLFIFVTFLLFNWLFSSTKLSPSALSDENALVPSSEHLNALSTSSTSNHQNDSEDDVETFTQKKKRNHYREFLAIGCDASIVLFWISFSR